MPVDEGSRPALGQAASDLEYDRVVHCSREIERGLKGDLAVCNARAAHVFLRYRFRCPEEYPATPQPGRALKEPY